MDLSLRRDTKRLLLLIVLLGIYLVTGAAVFQILENETEQGEVEDLNYIRRFVMNKYNMSVEDFHTLTGKVENALSHRCQRTEESWCQNRWTYYASLYFTASVVTTIGYGHLAPSTFGGRMFCMVFALLGIPLNLMVLKHIGDRINEFIHWCHYKIETKICKRDVTVLKTKTLLWSAALMVIMLLLGGVLYSQSEDWRFLDAVYYCFITFSTIGFGDLVPNQGKEPSGAYDIAMEILQALVVILGLSILFSIISSVLTVSEEIRVTFPPSKYSTGQQTSDEDMRSEESIDRKVPDARHAGWRDMNAFAAIRKNDNTEGQQTNEDVKVNVSETKTWKEMTQDTNAANPKDDKVRDKTLTREQGNNDGASSENSKFPVRTIDIVGESNTVDKDKEGVVGTSDPVNTKTSQVDNSS